MQNLLDDLTALLQAEQAFISDGAILKNAVIEAALNMDARLLELLMQSETIKAHFFTEVAGALVFDKVKFQDFVSNKAFLPDSYTAFKNRIGLTDGRGDYLSQSRDVVLAWPYKDCVLEGGMTKEDRGRNEVFWNTTLAPDDITRLFEPKVLTGWERWDAEAVAAGKAKPVGEVSDGDNLLIKGNNLLALHSLKACYAGKVKLIYIDPPFNTGDDSFRYNDRFNHSTWLTFMRNRLEVARDLLANEGAVAVILDDTEIHYCKVLMDEVFGAENYITTVSVEAATTSSFKTVNTGPTQVTNFILCYSKRKSSFEYHVPYIGSAEVDLGHFSRFIENFEDPCEEWRFKGIFSHVLDGMGFSGETPNSQWAKAKKELGAEEATAVATERANEFAIENAYRVFETKTLQKPSAWLTEHLRRSRDLDYVIKLDREGLDPIYLYQGRQVYFLGKGLREIDGEKLVARPVSNLWTDIPTNNLQSEGGISFPAGKKPEALLRRIVQMFSSSKDDIVLDFFSGSGTTAAVAHKMRRKWIAVEQMDYILDLPASRFKKVIEGEQSGISKAVEWQGGGSFVYAELAASNSAFADRIEAAPDMAALQSIHTDMKATGYLRYDVDLSAFDTDDFAALPLEDAKRVLMDCLDANHLYVNLGSLGDADFDISDEDARATRSFYGLDQ
ncbi:DNA methyltransferase [Celeribacter sp.]|uniref:DNA methyltransferase n=1 Tax=Celeribacter sp. TaxID=1890673 RepID=UPI003A938D39